MSLCSICLPDENRDVTALHLQFCLFTYILLGLDFYIIADIIATMLHPEWNELISLATIGLLRTTIGYFLGKELLEK